MSYQISNFDKTELLVSSTMILFKHHIKHKWLLYLALVFALIFSSESSAQTDFPIYYFKKNVPFKTNIDLPQALSGGLNSPHFSSFDIDNDGDSDLLVFDRTDGKILPFLKVGNPGQPYYEYAPQYEIFFPKGQNFYKSVDINRDGKADIATLINETRLVLYKNITQATDSFPKFESYGDLYYRNYFPDGHFIEYNRFVMSKFDLPSFKDIDADGDIDVVTYDPYNLGYTLYANLQVEKGLVSGDSFRFRQVNLCYGDFAESGAQNEILLGQCNIDVKIKYRHANGSSCEMIDMDEDGDLDMLISNIGFDNIIYLENGKKDFNTYWDTFISYDSIFPRNSIKAADYIFPAPHLVDVDGDGVRDLLVAPHVLSGGRELNQVFYYKNIGKNDKPNFEFQTRNFLQDLMIDFGGRTAPAFVDYDADGDFDLVVAHNGDAELTASLRDEMVFFENVGNKKSPNFVLTNTHFLDFKKYGISEAKPHFGDVDKDGDIDLLVGTRNGFIWFFKNTAGIGQTLNLVLEDTNLLNIQGFPSNMNYSAAPSLFDYDGDEFLDLLVGYYGGHVSLYKNVGNQTEPQYLLIDETAWEIKGNEYNADYNPPWLAAGYATPVASDLNLDGKQEILVGTSFGKIRIYQIGNELVSDSLEELQNKIHQLAIKDSMVPDFGSFISLALADLNGDTIPEIMVGNNRGGLNFLSATRNDTGKVSIRNFSIKENLRLYPNPTNGRMKLYRENIQYPLIVKWSDFTGRQLGEKVLQAGYSQMEIDLHEYPNGIYFVNYLIPGIGQASDKVILLK